MVTVHPIAAGVRPDWQPLVFQCPKRHWHNWHAPTDYKCPEELPDGSQPIDQAYPSQVEQKLNPPLPEPQLHEALNGLRNHKAAWDISEDPLMARCMTSRGVSEPIPAVVLNQPATRPAIRNMRIISHSFPWEIRIHVPDNQDKVITVGLVLEAIHGVMREDLDVEYWEKKSATLKKKIHMEMCARFSKEEPSLETTFHVMKIDCLLGSTEFMGLEFVQGECVTWLLSLGPAVG